MGLAFRSGASSKCSGKVSRRKSQDLLLFRMITQNVLCREHRRGARRKGNVSEQRQRLGGWGDQDSEVHWKRTDWS